MLQHKAWLINSILFILIFLLHGASSVTSKKALELYVVDKFAPSNAIINHLAVDQLGNAYVGAQNKLYQLDKHFKNVLGNITVGPEFDYYNCLPGKECDKKLLTNNTNKLLLVDKGRSRLIACGSIFQGLCVARNLENISEVLSKMPDPFEIQDIITSDIKGGTIVGIIAEGPTVNNSVLYIAATLSGDSYYSHEKTITTRSLHYDPDRENTIFKFAIPLKRQGRIAGSVLKNVDPRGQSRAYKYIFETGGTADGFIYFVFSRTGNTDGNYRFIVARICKADHFYYSYLELPINCGEELQEYDIIGAYYSPNDSKGNSGTLYILYLIGSKSGQTGSIICSYTKDELDIQFRRIMEVCYKNRGKFPESGKNNPPDVKSLSLSKCENGNSQAPLVAANVSLDSLGPPAADSNDVLAFYPDYKPPITKLLCGAYYLPQHLTATWVTSGKLVFKKDSTDFTAMTVNEVSGEKVGYIGTTDGSVLQVKLSNGSEYNSIQLGSRILSDFIWDQDKSLLVPHLYVTTASQVLRIRVAACEKKFPTCDTCIQSRDPYCGWCILESRCTTEKECSTANDDKTRWLGPGSPQCLIIDPPKPVDSSEPSGQLQFAINPLPSLERGEIYQCVYNNSTTYNVTLERVNVTAATVSCLRPAGSALSPTPIGEDYQNVTLSLRFNQKVDIISTSIQYYDCSVYGRRKEMHRPCADCLGSRWKCRWCIADGQCLSQTGRSVCVDNPEQCPTVLSVVSQTRLIPVGIMQNITLLTKNLPLGGTPKCVVKFLSLEQKKVEVKAKISGNQVICNEHAYNYSKEEQSAEAYVTLHWKLSYVVDSARDENSTLTFYKCDARRSDCSRCVTADPKYKCGWCGEENKCSIVDFCPGANTQPQAWHTDGQYCDALSIDSFEPTSGPTSGGTELHIFGINMGTKETDIESVLLGSIPCKVVPDRYEISILIVCKTGNVSKPLSAAISVTVKGQTKTTSERFVYRDPILTSVSPRKGPQAGGTLLTISGSYLDTGRSIQVTIGDSHPCVIQGAIASNGINCKTTSSVDPRSDLDVSVTFDGFTQSLPRSFSYDKNPRILKVTTLSPESFTSFLFGGRNVSIKGSNFTLVQKPSLSVNLQNSFDDGNIKLPEEVFDRDYSSSCDVMNNTFMYCYTPTIINNIDDYDVPANLSTSWFAKVTFIMDQIVVQHNQSLEYLPNPHFETWKEPVVKNKIQLLTIKAYNLEQAITKSEVHVLLGEHFCPVTSIEDEILCTVPDIEGVTEDQEFSVTVRISQNSDVFVIGKLLYDVESPLIGTPGIIGIAFAVIAVAVGCIVAFVFIFRNRRRYKENKNDYQKAMANLEMQVRNDFRKAFAELNVELTDLTADIGDYGIPCLDYRTYVTNLFFPSFKYHPCTKPPEASAPLQANMEQGLSQFLLLLSNHNFLSSFIHTLEEQKSFSNRDKGNVASLLTVALHHKLDYFTEIMKSLIKDLISVSVQRNAKLIFRRSDSVAERMLSNWMYICLYPYLRDKAGGPIFLLLKAIKQQVSKGPVDVVTGKARYTLSDDRLLQEDVENQLLTLFVAPHADTDDEPVIVKVLSCDSIAQVKEKVMDAVYKRIPFSQRPKADQLDLEWRQGQSGHLVLPNEDYSTEPNSRWRRLMTIADYKVVDNSTLALIARKHEYDGSQDQSSMASSHVVDANPTSPMLSEEHFRMYHLTKFNDDVEGKRESTINRDRHKHIQEIYLLRLINMKGILQTYVDAVFHAILDDSSIPGPVKHFFHFLDELAQKHGITDPEILHIWKTNSPFGRFWLTILNNPDSVFDIEKPDTITSTMAVISQTFIDACSVSEHKPNKDSPINKQLYAKEIPNYKKLVQEYYKVIKEQAPISDQDVNAYIAGISREHQCEFDVNVALKELWGYLNKYYEEVNESLENDVNISSVVKQKLQQTYNLIDTA